MRIVFATGNPNKLIEIKEILADIADEIVTMKQAGVNVPIDENGRTFEENALIKVRTVAAALPAGEDSLVMADDSGLVVDALDGEPGIYSARYMGEDTSYRIKNANIIDRLSEVPDEKRTARFVCAVACHLPDGRDLTAKGVMEGRIAWQEMGANGFGYDPIFFLPQYGKTSAEISPEEKNAISHRGQALRMMREKLKKELG